MSMCCLLLVIALLTTRHGVYELKYADISLVTDAAACCCCCFGEET